MSIVPRSRGWSRKCMKLLGLAANGNPEAQYELGNRFLTGKGVPQNVNLAIEWLIKASDRGNEEAQYLLYTCYTMGKGVPKNPKIALGFLMMSADGANKYAQYELGEYYQGKNHYDEAIEWFKKSARQEYAPAQMELGRCYYYGLGSIRAEEIALGWIQRAIDHNHQPAKDLLRVIEREARKRK